MEKEYNFIEETGEAALVVKELDGRVYFEALPLMTVCSAVEDNLKILRPSSVTGVRG